MVEYFNEVMPEPPIFTVSYDDPALQKIASEHIL